MFLDSSRADLHVSAEIYFSFLYTKPETLWEILTSSYSVSPSSIYHSVKFSLSLSLELSSLRFHQMNASLFHMFVFPHTPSYQRPKVVSPPNPLTHHTVHSCKSVSHLYLFLLLCSSFILSDLPVMTFLIKEDHTYIYTSLAPERQFM